jgi:hypothetical protein
MGQHATIFSLWTQVCRPFRFTRHQELQPSLPQQLATNSLTSKLPEQSNRYLPEASTGQGHGQGWEFILSVPYSWYLRALSTTDADHQLPCPLHSPVSQEGLKAEMMLVGRQTGALRWEWKWLCLDDSHLD